MTRSREKARRDENRGAHHLCNVNYFNVTSRMILSPRISRISIRLTAVERC